MADNGRGGGSAQRIGGTELRVGKNAGPDTLPWYIRGRTKAGR